jgi:magnesium and cobalt transporter
MALLKLFKFFKKDKENIRNTIEELIEEVKEEEPSIDDDELLLLGNVLNLKDLEVKDVMVPRADIVAAPLNMDLDEQMNLLIKTKSLLPVYMETLDHIIGTLDIYDVFKWMLEGKKTALRALVKDALFISPTMPILDLLIHMRETGAKMGFVVDEYGGIDGLVTLDVLVEQIIGDIQDAHEQQALKSQFELKTDGTLIVDGRATVKQVEDYFKSHAPFNDTDEDIDTIGGLIVFIAGHVPVRGEIISFKGLEFEILSADPRRIYRMSIRQL